MLVWVASGWVITDLTVGLLHTQQLMDVSCGTAAGELLIGAKSILVFYTFLRLVWPQIKTGWESLRKVTLSF
ncbi:hypothetical protein A2590_00830 [Candidatus Adlerbacteria bacterium RIFOXYD1_FULL_48_8]|nr:MAG: hypothetical protein A2590_00830 [Candidatus Adlerbacteria bacterium RIFOXYD1_FULL_48_8]